MDDEFDELIQTALRLTDEELHYYITYMKLKSRNDLPDRFQDDYPKEILSRKQKIFGMLSEIDNETYINMIYGFVKGCYNQDFHEKYGNV